jgi:uncharacterized protein (DUF2384 family)
MTNGRKRDGERFLSGQMNAVRLLRSWGITERSCNLLLLLCVLQSAHSATVGSRHRDFVKSVLKSYRLYRISRKKAARLLGCDPQRLSVLLCRSASRETTGIRRLRSRAAEILGGARAADEWLNSPLPVLGGLSPLAHAAQHSHGELFGILGRIEHGVFS